jgi:hypothetical protein
MDGSQTRVITLESGNGLLDARALWASIVGPQRLAMAQRKPVTLKLGETVMIAKNLGGSDVYVLCGVSLPFPAPTKPLAVVFGYEEQLGFNTGLPILLTDSQTNFTFTQLLLPGEQLFAQITDPAVASQNVVVSTVMF